MNVNNKSNRVNKQNRVYCGDCVHLRKRGYRVWRCAYTRERFLTPKSIRSCMNFESNKPEWNATEGDFQMGDNYILNPIFSVEERQAMCVKMKEVKAVAEHNSATIESLREEIARLEKATDALSNRVRQIEHVYDIIYDCEAEEYRLMTDADVVKSIIS